MKKSTLSLMLSMTLLVAFAAADQEFSDQAEWEAALTGETVLASDYSQFTGNDLLEPIEGPIAQPWGNISFFDSGNEQASSLDFVVAGQAEPGEAPVGFVFPNNLCASLNIDSEQGVLEGFGFNFQVFAGGDLTIFDSQGVVVSTFTLSPATEDSDDQFFGWVNCDGVDVGHVEICSEAPFNVIANDTYSFNPVADAEPTCQGMLQEIIDDLNEIRSLASADDQYWIDWAIYDLTNAQDPTFWATEDRLSDHGCGFFGSNFWATYDLECVSDGMLVEGALIAIQDLLSCVVDSEIDFAIENGGNSNLLTYANYFESFADSYSEAGLYLHAVILHFYAWLFANYST